MFFLIPLLVIGVLALAGRHASTPTPAPAPVLPAPAIASGTPSPLSVLNETLRTGMQPPPMLIMCAIAEAETIGRTDLVHAIVDRFIAPVVYAAEQAQAQQYAPAPPLASDAWGPPPPHNAPPMPAMAPPMNAPQHDNAGQAIPVDPANLDDALRAVFAQSGAPPVAATAAPIVAGDLAMHMMASPPPDRRSPIRGIDGARWSAFVGALSREAPTFVAPRHVGQFRHRKDRLNELGIDPDTLIGEPSAQIAALEADLRDAYAHAREGGLVGFVGMLVAIPGADRQHSVTLSGVLGVIQAAGLEGAADWFDHFNDRIKFPHTTAAFLRTNGVF